MTAPKIEHAGQYKTGSKLHRIIVSHKDAGKRLLGRYEIWGAWDTIVREYSKFDMNDNEMERKFAIDEFEALVEKNAEENTNYTGVFVPFHGDKVYGIDREFPGKIAEKDKDPTVRTNISLTENQYQWARLQAAKENTNVSEVIREALVNLENIECPHCKSSHARKTGFAHGIGTGPKLPDPISKQYECLDCKKLFNYPRSSK
jgi:hypothetical protein